MSVHSLIGGAEIIDGQFVSQKVRQVVDAIREYSPEISVAWIPPNAREEGQAAYRLIHSPMGREPYIMMTVRRDEDMTPEVLKRIIASDQRNGTVSLSEYEAWEEAQRRVAKQAQLDAMEEANDIAYHVFRTHKNTYKVNDDLIIKDGIPFNAAPKRRKD